MKPILTSGEKRIELLSKVVLGFTIIYGVYMFIVGPDKLPTHFNLKGEADRYSSSSSILWFLLVDIVLYVGLTWLISKPKYFNYPIKITDENKAAQYQNMVELSVRLKLLIVVVFLILLWMMVDYQMVLSYGLTKLPFVFISLLILTTAVYVFKSFKLK